MVVISLSLCYFQSSKKLSQKSIGDSKSTVPPARRPRAHPSKSRDDTKDYLFFFGENYNVIIDWATCD